MEVTRQDLDSTRQQLDSAIQVRRKQRQYDDDDVFCVALWASYFTISFPPITLWFHILQVLAKNSVSDIEKREKKVLEKKLGEMEDELKVSDSLKNGIATRKIRRSF